MEQQKDPPRGYIPKPEELNEEFFKASMDGELHLQRCDNCGTYRHPARHYCSHCFSGKWSWVASSGEGMVSSWVTTHKTIDPGWVDSVPYTSVIVELEEGPRILGSLRGSDAANLTKGARCRLVGETKSDAFVFFWVEVLS